jgi:DNA-directed RNA polymerase subunit omega
MVKVIYPSIDKLLNIVDSKYKLVHIAADRAKVMKEHKHYQVSESEYVSKKEIGRALEELGKGLITVKENN